MDVKEEQIEVRVSDNRVLMVRSLDDGETIVIDFPGHYTMVRQQDIADPWVKDETIAVKATFRRVPRRRLHEAP